MTNLTQFIGEFDASKYSGNYEYNTDEHPRFAIIRIMEEYGFKPPHGMPVGKLIRFPDAQDKAGKKSGWGIYYESINGGDIIGTIVFGSHHGDPEKVTWSSKKPEYMSPEQKIWHTKKIEHARREAERERAALNSDMAKEAQRIYEAAPDVKNHAYVSKKKIRPYRAKIYNDFLLLPIYIDEQITSLQYIDPKGIKTYMPGGAIKGGYCILPGDNSRIFVCEGWATGCSIREATGNTVYVAYQLSNLYDVTSVAQKQNESSLVVIAADNDRFTDGNPGLNKAIVVGQSLMCEVVSPHFNENIDGTDFNDIHASLGIKEVKTQLIIAPPAKAKEDAPEQKDDTHAVPYQGVIKDIVSYYNATSGTTQPGFALQTALALVSFYCGRYFMTDQKNTSTLYFLNIGRTGVGKEHIKTVIEEVLYATGDHTHIGGDGFTSDSSLVGMLMHCPRTIVSIDEFGRYMGSAQSAGMAYQKASITAMMEAITRTTGVLRAKNYSSFGMTQEQMEQLKNRVVMCPALTITANTTPETFYENINIQNIKDGFLGRFILYESEAERQLFKDIALIDVPKSIIDWIATIKKRTKSLVLNEDSSQKPEHIIIPFSEEAKAVRDNFALEVLEIQKELDKEGNGIGGLPARIAEFAMRLALGCALSRNPMAKSITLEDMKWACDYMRRSMNLMLLSVKRSMTGSPFDAHKREVCDAIYKIGEISWKEMQGVMPFMKHKPKDLKEMLASLIDGEIIIQEPSPNPKGRPTMVYKPTPQNQDFALQSE